MIHQNEPLSMAEALEYSKNSEANNFIKSFISIKPEKAKIIRKDLENLNLIKLNKKIISKLIDFLPEDKDTLNKIIQDVSLDEDESNKIIETIKKHI